MSGSLETDSETELHAEVLLVSAAWQMPLYGNEDRNTGLREKLTCNVAMPRPHPLQGTLGSPAVVPS